MHSVCTRHWDGLDPVRCDRAPPPYAYARILAYLPTPSTGPRRRYTSLVDRHIPNIAACLRDPSALVRRQTLVLLMRLLQEDFVKWKGSLFFRFVSGLVDDDATVADFGTVPSLFRTNRCTPAIAV